jgi:hypothetical protein
LQLKEILVKDPTSVLETRYKVFISEQCALLKSQLKRKSDEKVVVPNNNYKDHNNNDPLELGYSPDELLQLTKENALLLVEVQ